PLLDALLRRGQRLGQPRRRFLLALGQLAAPLLRDAPLLLDEERGRVGPGPGDRVLELDGPVCELGLDRFVQALLRSGEVRVDVSHVLEQRPRPPERDERARGCGQTACGGGQACSGSEREGNPRRRRAHSDEAGDRGREAGPEAPANGGHDRDGDDDDAGREDDLEDESAVHASIVRRYRQRWRRTSASPRQTSEAASALSARSEAVVRLAASSASSPPPAKRIVPVTDSTRRRTVRTWVERCLWARLENVAKRAAATASVRIRSAIVKQPVNVGKPPHDTANHQSPWKRPPKSSRLYTTTRKPPHATNGSSHRPRATATATP